jgi:hypothetical protein
MNNRRQLIADSLVSSLLPNSSGSFATLATIHCASLLFVRASFLTDHFAPVFCAWNPIWTGFTLNFA